MNYLIDAQIQNIIVTIQAFNQNCQLAAQQDGKLNQKEAKALKHISAASEKFIRELKKIKQ